MCVSKPSDFILRQRSQKNWPAVSHSNTASPSTATSCAPKSSSGDVVVVATFLNSSNTTTKLSSDNPSAEKSHVKLQRAVRGADGAQRVAQLAVGVSKRRRGSLQTCPRRAASEIPRDRRDHAGEQAAAGPRKPRAAVKRREVPICQGVCDGTARRRPYRCVFAACDQRLQKAAPRCHPRPKGLIAAHGRRVSARWHGKHKFVIFFKKKPILLEMKQRFTDEQKKTPRFR